MLRQTDRRKVGVEGRGQKPESCRGRKKPGARRGQAQGNGAGKSSLHVLKAYSIWAMLRILNVFL